MITWRVLRVGRKRATESIVRLRPKELGVGVERGGAGGHANQPQKGVIVTLCIWACSVGQEGIRIC